MNILEIRGLKKRFGSLAVIQGLDLCVPEHSVFGFVGKNGAGKTTTMKMILGLLRPDGGTIAVCGEAVAYGNGKTNRSIGYLPDIPAFYGTMRPM
jgi:ABC-2 type transport system ATP-binding protein